MFGFIVNGSHRRGWIFAAFAGAGIALPLTVLAAEAPAAGSSVPGQADPLAATVPAPHGAGDRAGRFEARGLVRPLRQSSIATDLGVPVVSIPKREAMAFVTGDVLVTFDCERLKAEGQAARAVWREMKLTLDSNVYLDRKGAVGRIDVEISKARLDKADADAKAIEARLKHCSVAAPFDGRVVELAINEHEVPAPGKPFITIVDETNFEIDLIVPSAYLRHVKPGHTFSYRIDETGTVHPARVLRTGASVDPVSQTVKIIAAFEQPDARVVAGMSGSAVFDIPEVSQ